MSERRQAAGLRRVPPAQAASIRRSRTGSSPSLKQAGCRGCSLGARAKAAFGLPKNAATGRRYSGVNILILWGAVIERGFASQHWLTFRQALDLGGNVRKGERGTTVCYADRFIPKGELERAGEDGDEPEAVPFLKRFTVFNVDAVRRPAGALLSAARRAAPRARNHPRRRSADRRDRRRISASAGRGPSMCAAPTSSRFRRNPPSYEQINYYRTCFHELGHWTGHPSRLARDLSGGFGSQSYAREELVAEMASAFVCARSFRHSADRAPRRLSRLIGSTCCARTTAPSSAPQASPPRRRISSSPSAIPSNPEIPPQETVEQVHPRRTRGPSLALRSSETDEAMAGPPPKHGRNTMQLDISDIGKLKISASICAIVAASRRTFPTSCRASARAAFCNRFGSPERRTL